MPGCALACFAKSSDGGYVRSSERIVSIACSLESIRLGFEVVRVLREVLGARLGDEDVVLEPHTAVPLPVETRLDRDAVAGDELLVGDEPETRRLVDLEADAVAEAVEEAVGERLARLLRPLRHLTGGLEDLAAPVVQHAPLD